MPESHNCPVRPHISPTLGFSQSMHMLRLRICRIPRMTLTEPSLVHLLLKLRLQLLLTHRTLLMLITLLLLLQLLWLLLHLILLLLLLHLILPLLLLLLLVLLLLLKLAICLLLLIPKVRCIGPS